MRSSEKNRKSERHGQGFINAGAGAHVEVKDSEVVTDAPKPDVLHNSPHHLIPGGRWSLTST